MNFPVPWRALLPADAVSTFSGNDGLREICDITGAGCELSGDGDVPASLSDKILTISGNVEQKEAACRRVVDKLRVLQDVVDQEPGVFVIIVPSTAAPAVIGSKGAQIKEVIELSGAEVSVAKESIVGMNDQPIGVTGTGGQVVSAVSKINAILQDLADRGRLQPTDFRYRPGSVREESATSFGHRAAPPTGGNPRSNAKFVVATQVAGWIIGKQGRHIRELQDNSGAHIQVMKEGEVPPGVPPSDRIVEIGGRPDAKAEGIQIILIAVDSMPAMSAPKETLMLIPRQLTTDSEVKDVRQMSGCEVEVRDLPSHDEGLCTLIGTLEARVKAAQQFLKRLEEVMGDGSVPSSFPPASAPSRPLVDKDDPWSRSDPWSRGAPKEAERPREEVKVTFDNHPQVTNIQASYAPRDDGFGASSAFPSNGTNGSMSFAPSGPSKMSFGPDPGKMSFGPKDPVGGKMSFSPDPGKMSFGPTDPVGGTSFSPSEPPGKMSFGPSEPSAGKMSFSPEPAQGKMSFGPSEPSGGKMSFGPNDPPGGKMSFGPSEPSGGMSFGAGGSSGGSKMSFAPSEPSGGKMSFGPNDPPGGKMSFGPTEPSGGKMSFGPSEPSGKMSFSPSEPTGGKMSFGPSEPSGGKMSFSAEPTGGKMSFGPSESGSQSLAAKEPAGGKTSFSPNDPETQGSGINPFGQIASMGMGMGLDGMGSEMMFRAALQQGMVAASMSTLHLMLPSSLLQKTLIPKGHLAEISKKCQVQIDLGQEVAPDLRQVTLKGGLAANAMAAYFLQERALPHNG